MTLREVFEQHITIAQRFSGRMKKLSESIKEYETHIKRIIKNDSRSKAEILSATEKLSFELDCAIESAEEYCDIIKDNLLSIGEYNFNSELSVVLQRLPDTLKIAATCLGRINGTRVYRPKALIARADKMDIALEEILETPCEQIKLIEKISNDIRGALLNNQINRESKDNKALGIIFTQFFSRYIREESDLYSNYKNNIIVPQESLNDLYFKARDDKFLNIWRGLLDASIFMRRALKEGLTEKDLLVVFDYLCKESILREKITPPSASEYPKAHYNFIKGVGITEKKRKASEIINSIVEVCPQYCPKSGKKCKTCKSKSKVLQEVFSDRISDIDDLPKYNVFNDLFGEAISISEPGYIAFANNFSKYYHLRPKKNK